MGNYVFSIIGDGFKFYFKKDGSKVRKLFILRRMSVFTEEESRNKVYVLIPNKQILFLQKLIPVSS